MKTPDIPINEQERLAALQRYDILDTSPEQEFDDIVHLVADICDTPTTLVSLIDENRQWFKARIGMSVTETTRDISFCGHVVASESLLVIPDTIEDARFADNPLVTHNPKIRFYAGVPLTTPDNYVLGTLCAIDYEPRTLSSRQIQQLEALSRLVMSQLELRRSEQRSRLLASAVESSNDAIITNTLDGVITSWNAAATRLYGYTKAEIIGQSILGLIPPGYIDEELKIFDPCEPRTQTQHFETTRIRKDGRKVEVALTLSPLYDEHGQVVGMSKIVRDITAKNKAQRQLAKLSTFQKVILDSANCSIITTDLQGTIQFFNAGAERLLGYQAVEVVGKASLSLLHVPDEVTAQAQSLSEQLQCSIVPGFEVFITKAKQGHDVDEEWTYIRKDGSRVPVLLSVSAMQDAQGEITGFMGIAKDITVQKQAEKQIQDITAALNQVAIVIITNADGIITFANDNLCKVSKYSRDELVGHPYKILDSDHHSQKFFVAMWRTIAKGQPWQAEVQHRAKDGSPYWIDVTIVPFLDDQGKPYQYLAIATNITKRKHAEAELKKRDQERKLAEEKLHQTNQELARATRMKDEFLANMSHELRTPLNAILGMAEGLQEGVFGDMNPKQLRSLQTIERSGTHLLELINDILDIAKIESGQIQLDCMAVATDSLCHSSLTFVTPQALKKSIQVTTSLPPNLPDLWADERRIRQVLINLLNNAVKFTPEGGCITLEVALNPSKEETPLSIAPASGGDDIRTSKFLRITVTDSGIGIAPDNLERIFQPFIQIDSAFNRQYSGTGLGLALVKQIVELHGGQVGVTSNVGVGSCFTIDLPYVLSTPLRGQLGAQTEANTLPKPSISQVSPLILLVEDNEANINTMSSYLKAKGYRIVLASNGQEAIDQTQSHHPDIILMDIQMPGMDGLEAMQHIRRNLMLLEIPIIALTALAMQGDRERCLEAGATDYLTKPVKLKQLAVTIQQILMT